MFVLEAFANSSIFSSMNSLFTSIAPLLIIMVIFYFLVIRPQQTKLKNHHEMINAIKKGDKILTSGGIIAIVSKVELEHDTVIAEIATNVKVKIKRETISQIINI